MATRDSRRRVPVPPPAVLTGLRRGVVLMLLTAVAFLGGVATTQLWPVTTETDYFTADVSVTPRLDSTVELPTVVGDVIITFEGRLPAPGLTAQVGVREEVTDLLRSGRLDAAALQPDQQELRAAIDHGVREVGWKFATGALVTSVLVLLTYAVARPHHLLRVVGAATTATAVALAGPGAAAYYTYRVDNVAEYRATSLLSLVQTNTRLLDNLASNASHGAVYVTNLLALSDALREEFTPGTVDVPVAARFLLVSDLHGMNQFPLMRQIVASERIDAVIDSGDLLNFGQPREGDLTGMYAGIESLGVPYIFVRGNHDAVSATDEAVLRRLAQIPNVLLLEPTDGELVRVDVNGVSISGFNDARFYNQRDADFAGEQAALAERFRELTEGNEPTDLVVAHQPYAAERVEAAGATVNGHMHAPDVSRGHIQVGSFTGGGLVNQFRLPPLTEEAQQAAEEDPDTAGELQGHPYSFDVLSFGEDCSIVSLVRYSYRNLVSGRPQYDDVRLVNGRTIQPDPPQERTCGPSLGVLTSSLRPVVTTDEAVRTDDATQTVTIPAPAGDAPTLTRDDATATSAAP